MAKTLASMVASAKRYADMENSTFVADADWEEWVNRGIQVLWDKMVMARGVEYYGLAATITLVSGTEDYDMASDFGYLVSQYMSASGQEVPCAKFEWAMEPNLRRITANQVNLQYHIIGEIDATTGRAVQVKFLPVPGAGYVWHYRYVTTAPSLSSGTSFDAIGGWEEYAELHAALKAKVKEESDTTGIEKLMGMVIARIDRMKSARDKARPPRIKDTRQDHGRNLSKDWWR